MASKVQSLISNEKTDTTVESTNWTPELMPSIKKLRQAIQCLLKTAKLAYSIISLKVWWTIIYNLMWCTLYNMVMTEMQHLLLEN